MPGGRLKMPVRLFLDDFSNLRVPDFDKVISVTRSREVWCTVLCQSVAQLQGAYGEAGAETVMGNCDVQLVLAFQDNATTRAYAGRAGRTTDTLLATPLDESWLFVRGRKPSKVHKYDLTKHQRYVACAGGQNAREDRFDAREGGMR
jgi:type IV secretion system protein VirD4